MPLYLNDYFNEEALDPRLRISTMSITFKVSQNAIDLERVANECELKEDGIRFTDYNGVYRGIDQTGAPKRRRRFNNFFNSMTLGIVGDGEGRLVHFKLFKNGSVQCAGCKCVSDANVSIHHLVEALSPMIEVELTGIKINLINANFKLGFCVNRDKLHELFVCMGFASVYEKCKHAGVGVKYQPLEKESPISMFIFESGAVVLTGSKNDKHITEGFHFISAFAREHKEYVIQSQNTLQRAMANPKYAAMLLPVPGKKKKNPTPSNDVPLL